MAARMGTPIIATTQNETLTGRTLPLPHGEAISTDVERPKASCGAKERSSDEAPLFYRPGQ